MKLWIDATTPAPDDCLWCKGLDDSIEMIQFCERLQKYTDYDDSMYSEILEEFKDRKYRKEMYNNLDKCIELSK